MEQIVPCINRSNPSADTQRKSSPNQNIDVTANTCQIKYEEDTNRITIVDSDEESNSLDVKIEAPIILPAYKGDEDKIPQSQLKRKTTEPKGQKPRKIRKLVQCKVCCKTFISQRSRNEHNKRHLDVFPHYCYKYWEDFEMADEKLAHEDKCTSQIYVCSLCKYASLHKAVLERHVRKHSENIIVRSEGTV